MKFKRLPEFIADWGSLSKSEQDLFRKVAREKFSPACDEFAKSPSSFTWPHGLRAHPMKYHARAWEMTWSFKQPALRATFHFQMEGDEMICYWRRIGDHTIYDSP